MDNFELLVRSRGRETLALGLSIAFKHAPGGKAEHWTDIKNVLVLYWAADEGRKTQPLPFPLTAKTAVEFVGNWLDTRTKRFDEYKDGDVDNHPGFELTVGAWGHADDSHYGLVKVRPIWAWSGK